MGASSGKGSCDVEPSAVALQRLALSSVLYCDKERLFLWEEQIPRKHTTDEYMFYKMKWISLDVDSSIDKKCMKLDIPRTFPQQVRTVDAPSRLAIADDSKGD